MFARDRALKALCFASSMQILGAAAATEITVEPLAGTPGSTLQLYVSLAPNDDIAALQFDLNFDPAKLTFADPVTGSASADHRLASNIVTDGLLRIVTYSMTNSLLHDGVLTTIPVTIAAGAPQGTLTIERTMAVASNSSANALPTLTVTSGSIDVGDAVVRTCLEEGQDLVTIGGQRGRTARRSACERQA